MDPHPVPPRRRIPGPSSSPAPVSKRRTHARFAGTIRRRAQSFAAPPRLQTPCGCGKCSENPFPGRYFQTPHAKKTTRRAPGFFCVDENLPVLPGGCGYAGPFLLACKRRRFSRRLRICQRFPPYQTKTAPAHEFRAGGRFRFVTRFPAGQAAPAAIHPLLQAA